MPSYEEAIARMLGQLHQIMGKCREARLANAALVLDGYFEVKGDNLVLSQKGWDDLQGAAAILRRGGCRRPSIWGIRLAAPTRK